MAMGFSTQTSGFKPWLRSPSSRSFWASSKMAHLFRRPVCALQSTKNHFLDVTLVNSSAGVRQSSCYSNLPFHKTIGFRDPRCFSVEQMKEPKLLSGNPVQWLKVAERMRKVKTEVCHNNNKKNHNHTSGVINDFQDKVNDFEDGGADVMEFHTANLHNMGTEKLVGPGQTHNDQYTLEILSPRHQSNIQEQGLDPEDEGNINGWSGLVSGKQGNKTDIDRWEDISSTRMTPEEGPPNGLSVNHSNRRKETSPKKDEGIATGGPGPIHPRERLIGMYDKVLVVDNVSAAHEIVLMLTNQYRHLVHACDTEVAGIDVKQETPVDHGEIVCFSIYSGPEADFRNGKSCIWVDVLDGGGRNLLAIFAPFFEDPSIKKVWHNYSFDNHVIENYGLKVSGFHADTMHMARLWDSSRKTAGGYSLEALTSNPEVMTEKSDWMVGPEDNLIGKVSMNTIFGNRKVRIDGSEGKVITIPHIEELQRVERIPWICYSALDSISTRKLYENLKRKLSDMKWEIEGIEKGSMFDFYENYWRPFGELLVKMEKEGMLVDTAYLAKIEKVAMAEQQIAADRFRKWASSYCSDAKYMNVGSDMQLRQLFFGAIQNSEDPSDNPRPENKEFTALNCDNVIEESKKIPRRFRKITLHKIGKEIKSEFFTKTGKPSMNGDALKALAGKVSEKYDFTDESFDFTEAHDTSAYGPAYDAFGGGNKGIEACHAIASLCEVCSIDALISNFILPLQSSRVSGKNGRVHCSLNINTETGRLSARRPNLQNQPALEKDRYKIRQAFIAAPGNSLIVADYGQLELRILAHLANCKSMLDAFKAGGDFHSRTAMNMYPYIRDAVEKKDVLLEWYPQPGEAKPPVPVLKDAFASERRKAKMLNFSIAYGKTPHGLARDWKVSLKEAREIVALWYSDRKEVLGWQEIRKKEAFQDHHVYTLLGRARTFPPINKSNYSQKGHIERAAINTPVQGSAADVSMLAMLELAKSARLKELGWKLVLQIHDEVILEGPTESAEVAKGIVVECMSKPFNGKNILRVDLSVDAKFAQNWYAAK